MLHEVFGVAFVLFDAGFLKAKVHYTAVKDSIFFSYRCLPEELQVH